MCQSLFNTIRCVHMLNTPDRKTIKTYYLVFNRYDKGFGCIRLLVLPGVKKRGQAKKSKKSPKGYL